MTATPDVFDLRADGTIRVVMDDTEVVLRRPKNRERRELRDAIVHETMAELEDAKRLQATMTREALNREQRRAADRDDPITAMSMEEFYERQADREDALVAWWVDKAFPMLATSNVTGITREDVPSWLANFKTLSDALEHWRSVPVLPGADSE